MQRLTERKLWITLIRTLLSIAVVFVVFPVTTRAQSPGAREYLNIPVGQTVAYVDYVGTSAESFALDLALPNNVTVSRLIMPTVLASFPINNKYAGLSLSVPYSKVEVAGPGGNVETRGFNDPAIGFHKNLFGLPAFRHDEARPAAQTFMSVHFTFNPPVGSYDRNAPVNTGANRWAFTPLVNLNIPLKQGVAWVEVYAWGRFFTDNNEFQGSNQLSQRPLGIVALHFSHNLGSKTWASIGGYYDYGGETSINQVAQDDFARAFRSSVAINRRVGNFVVMLRYENTASKPNAAPWSGLLNFRLAFPPLFNF